MVYFVYVLQSAKDNKLYYGFTTDLLKQLDEHNKGRVQSTRPRAPFVIVYYEQVESIQDARKKEKYFKSGFGRKYIQSKLQQKAPSSSG